MALDTRDDRHHIEYLSDSSASEYNREGRGQRAWAGVTQLHFEFEMKQAEA